MEKDNTLVNIHKLAASFQKIFSGIDQAQMEHLDAELVKMYPSDESEVLLLADYEEEGPSIGLSIYVSKPELKKNGSKMRFDKLMFEYLIRADVSKLPQMSECLNRMEQSGSKQFKIDFIPVSYTKDIDKYDIHLRIAKN